LTQWSQDVTSIWIVRSGYQDAAEAPDAPARIAAQSIIDATERMQAAEQEAVRLAGMLTSSMEVIYVLCHFHAQRTHAKGCAATHAAGRVR